PLRPCPFPRQESAILGSPEMRRMPQRKGVSYPSSELGGCCVFPFERWSECWIRPATSPSHHERSAGKSVADIFHELDRYGSGASMAGVKSTVGRAKHELHCERRGRAGGCPDVLATAAASDEHPRTRRERNRKSSAARANPSVACLGTGA